MAGCRWDRGELRLSESINAVVAAYVPGIVNRETDEQVVLRKLAAILRKDKTRREDWGDATPRNGGLVVGIRNRKNRDAIGNGILHSGNRFGDSDKIARLERKDTTRIALEGIGHDGTCVGSGPESESKCAIAGLDVSLRVRNRIASKEVRRIARGIVDVEGHVRTRLVSGA